LDARQLNVYPSYPRLNFLGEWKQSLLIIDSIGPGPGTPSLGKFTLSAAVPGKEVELGSLRVLAEDDLPMAEKRQARLD
jgi:hypothetical protein